MLFSEGLKNEFEIAVVYEPSVFEPLKFYCTYANTVDPFNRQRTRRLIEVNTVCLYDFLRKIQIKSENIYQTPLQLNMDPSK